MHEETKSVTVIGGGLGGISAALALAQVGYDVSLYEKNNHLGGKLNRLTQDGFGFDLGPSILTMPQIFEHFFKVSGKKMADYVPIERVEHEWRAFFPDQSYIDLYGDLEMMLSENADLTAEDMAEYEDLLAYTKKLYDMTVKGYFNEGLDTTSEVIKFHGPIKSVRGFDLFSTMYEGIAKRISNPKLRDMLSYFIKYVGSSPYDAPAVLNMMIYMQHAQGVWHVPGGMHLLADGLVKLAKESGVLFHTGEEITELTQANGRITGAVTASGSVVTSDYYISNMEVIPAYERLLREDDAFIASLKDKFKPASSGLVIHLGVDKLYPQLGHHNFFFPENLKEQMDKIFHDQVLPDDPTIYLVNVNKTDPSQTQPGHENLKILPHIPYIQEDPFTATDYADLEERVLDKLERMGLTDLRKHIVTRDVWTPHDIETNYYSDRGAIYGTLSDKKQNRGFKHPKTSERYDNLYFVGGTVNPGGGMPMVTLSGQQVRDKIVQRDL